MFLLLFYFSRWTSAVSLLKKRREHRCTKHNVSFWVNGDMMTRFKKPRLKLDHLSLALLVTSQLKMLGTLDGNLLATLALSAFQTKYQLLCSLGLLPQDGFRLTTETLLFAIVTPTSLCKLGLL